MLPWDIGGLTANEDEHKCYENGGADAGNHVHSYTGK